MMVGLPWGDPGVLWPCSLGWLGVGGSPGVAQVVARLSPFLIFVKGQGIFLKGVSWASCERLEVKGQKACVAGSGGWNPPNFLGWAIRQVIWRPHCRERAA